MASTLSPNACPETAWKSWVKDGGRLALRTGTGWGLLWLALFLARGWMVNEIWLTIVLLGAATGVVELAHLAVMGTVRDGRVGLGVSLGAIGDLLRTQRPLLGSSLRSRLVGGCIAIGILMALAAVIQALAGPSDPASPTKAIPHAPIWDWIRHSATVTYMGVMLRSRHAFSLVLPLMRDHGMDHDQAATLHDQAVAKNPWLTPCLIQPIGVCLVVGVILVPFLIPFMELWLAGILSCAYADLFGDGYQVKALARWKMPALGGCSTLHGT